MSIIKRAMTKASTWWQKSIPSIAIALLGFLTLNQYNTNAVLKSYIAVADEKHENYDDQISALCKSTSENDGRLNKVEQDVAVLNALLKVAILPKEEDEDNDDT